MMELLDVEDVAWGRAWMRSKLSIADSELSKCEHLSAMLINEGDRQNLVAKGTISFIWSRHLVDSAQLLLHVSRETTTWLDLGTGAGFPGVVCAILRPNTQFTLVEQRPLRTDWLQRVVSELELPNVSVVTANIAQLTTGPYDVISARAFAPLPRLLKLSAAFSTKATEWLLPKGRSAPQELRELKGWRHTFHVEQSVTDPQSGIIIGRLLGRT